MKLREVVAVSGYFNPITIGHIRYIREAKKIGDKLIVIVNSDEQVKLKGSFPFMPEEERMEIIMALKWVDKVVLSKDKDGSVCETLKFINPDFFANGGDRKNNNVPETEVCKDLDIEMRYGVGGIVKFQSSSKLIKNVIDNFKKYAISKRI